MTAQCPECGEKLPFSFGRQTCAQCRTVIVIRHNKDLEIQVAEVRPLTAQRAVIDLTGGWVGDDGVTYMGLCALCLRATPHFDLFPINVGKLIRVKREVKDKLTGRPKTIYMIMPMVKKAMACDKGCYADYVRLTTHPKRKKDGTLVRDKVTGQPFYPSFITLGAAPQPDGGL